MLLQKQHAELPVHPVVQDVPPEVSSATILEMGEVKARLNELPAKLESKAFARGGYVHENLTLEQCALRYIEHHRHSATEAEA